MGYRGDGYGIHGDVGDDDFHFGDERSNPRDREERSQRDDRGHEPEHGAAHGNLFGRAEHDAAGAFFQHREGDDPRGRAAAEDWNRRHGREGHEGSYAPDDGYRSYRDRHLAELDRDYDDWCREREQQFHRDFDDWRSRRQMPSSNQPGDEAMVLTDRAADRLGESEAEPARRGSRSRR